LLHRFSDHQPEEKLFPSRQFLEETVPPVARKQTIKHWLLMALRVLSLLFLCFLFAQPWLKNDGISEQSDLHHIIAIDRSLSMQTANRWDEAVAAAKDLIDELGTSQSVELVAFDQSLSVVADSEATNFELNQRLNSLQPGYGQADYGVAMQRLNRMAISQSLPTKVWMISDAQKSAFPAQRNALYAPGVKEFEFLSVVASEHNNVHLRATAFTFNEATARVTVQLGLSHALPESVGDDSAGNGIRPTASSSTEVTVRVSHLNDVLSQKRFLLSSDDLQTVVFDDLAIPAAEAPILTVSLAESDDLSADNRTEVIIRRNNPVDFAFLRQSSSSARAAEVFLSTALETDSSASINILNGAADRIEPSIFHLATSRDLSQADMGGDIQSFISDGKNALVYSRLPSNSVRSERITGTDVGLVDESHPLALGDIDWVGVTFYDVEEMAMTDNDRVLVSTADRQAILVERNTDSGKLLLLNDALDGSRSNLPLTPAFVELMQSIVIYFNSSAALPDTMTVGESLIVSGNVQVLDPNDKPLLQFDQNLNAEGITVDRPGVYRVIGVSDTHFIEVGLSSKESDLSTRCLKKQRQ